MSPGRHDNIVDLPTDPLAAPPPPSAPGRVHGLAIAGMATCALVGIVSMLAFITINWPGHTGRYVVGTFVFAGVGFLACASTAVLTAARDTYANDRPSDAE